MSEINAIIATNRDRAGKGTARQSRRDGLVPSVIYGEKKPANMINLIKKDFAKLIQNPRCMNSIITINVDKETHSVMLKDVQFHPVNDQPLHADFLRVQPTTKVVVYIPVDFINGSKSMGLKRGGVLNVVRHKVEMICEAAHIPEKLVCDLTPYQLGDTIHISAIDIPSTAKPTIDRDFTIASIAVPSGIKAALREEKLAAEKEAGEGEDDATAEDKADA